MIAHLYANDETFRRMLEMLEEDDLRLLAKRELPWINMFITLVYIDLEIVNYLFRERDDFHSYRYIDEETISIKVASYLYSMDKEEMRSVYYQFVKPKMMMDDFMVTTKAERLTVIAKLWNWKVEDVQAVDLIIAN